VTRLREAVAADGALADAESEQALRELLGALTAHLFAGVC